MRYFISYTYGTEPVAEAEVAGTVTVCVMVEVRVSVSVVVVSAVVSVTVTVTVGSQTGALETGALDPTGPPSVDDEG